MLLKLCAQFSFRDVTAAVAYNTIPLALASASITHGFRQPAMYGPDQVDLITATEVTALSFLNCLTKVNNLKVAPKVCGVWDHLSLFVSFFVLFISVCILKGHRWVPGHCFWITYAHRLPA